MIALNKFFSSLKEIAAGDDEDEGTSNQPPSKRLKVEPEKKKEKRHKVDEDEIQKMQWEISLRKSFQFWTSEDLLRQFL